MGTALSTPIHEGNGRRRAMTAIGRKTGKYLVVAKTGLQNNLAYAVNFFFDTFFYIFFLFIFINLWRTIYGQGQVIAGYSLSQMIWYCIITELIVVSTSSPFHELNNEIKSGNIAYLLNKPYNLLAYQFSHSLGLIGIKLVINAVAGIGFGLAFAGPLAGFLPGRLVFIVPVMIGAILVNYFALAALGLTAFWLEENTAFFWIYQKLTFMLGLFLPVEFFPAWLQKIALVLPFPYTTYGPAKLVVAFTWEGFLRIITMQGLYLTVFLVLSALLYRKGVRMLNVNGG